MHIHFVVGVSKGYTSQERSPTAWRIKAAPEEILLVSLWYTRDPARPSPAHSPPSTSPVAEPWNNDRTSEPHRKETSKKHKLQLHLPFCVNSNRNYALNLCFVFGVCMITLLSFAAFIRFFLFFFGLQSGDQFGFLFLSSSWPRNCFKCSDQADFA